MSDLDDAVIRKTQELLERLEANLPDGMAVMAWIYNREGADLDIISFASHESTAETLRLVRATASKLIARESREGRASPERWFEQPAGGAPGNHLVSSATVTQLGGHDRVQLWSRGGSAGELVVVAGDGERIAAAHGLVERAL